MSIVGGDGSQNVPSRARPARRTARLRSELVGVLRAAAAAA